MKSSIPAQKSIIDRNEEKWWSRRKDDWNATAIDYNKFFFCFFVHSISLSAKWADWMRQMTDLPFCIFIYFLYFFCDHERESPHNVHFGLFGFRADHLFVGCTGQSSGASKFSILCIMYYLFQNECVVCRVSRRRLAASRKNISRKQKIQITVWSGL